MKVQEEICDRCQAKDSKITIFEEGEIVCNNCGKVFEERIIVDEYEGRTFPDDGDNKIQRVSAPAKPEFGNELGVNLIIREKGKTRVVKTYSKYDKIQRNFIKIQNLLSSVNVSQNLIEKVKTYYDKLSKNMNMQGRKVDHIIIGLYYYACRKQNIAKTIKEITKMFKCIFPKLTERMVKNAFNSIKNEIVETYDENEYVEAEKNYIRVFIGDNIEKYELKMLAFQIVENINTSGLLEGKSPNTIAGLSLLLSYKLLNVNLDDKKEFYSTFSNKTTLSKSYVAIKDSLDKIIPEKYNNIILNGLSI